MLDEKHVTRGMIRDLRFFKEQACERANHYLWLYEYAAVIVMGIIVTCTLPFGVKEIFTKLIEKFDVNGASLIFLGICTASIAIICGIRLYASSKYKKYYEMEGGFSKKYHQYLNNYWSQSIDGEDPN